MEEIFINIDSKYRDKKLYPNETKFSLILNETYKNIISITITSLEINNSINYISEKKDNNYVTFHLPNKINDPEGTKIYLYEGLLQLITSVKTIFNDIFTGIFNTNGGLQQLKYNNKIFAEKYFYIFYLNENSEINFDFNSTLQPNILSQPLIIYKGWHSIYGIVIQITNYINNMYTSRQKYIISNPTTQPIAFDDGNFKLLSTQLKIFDRRFRHMSQTLFDCVRIDNINENIFTSNNLSINLNLLKQHIYRIYIKDITTFIAASSNTIDTSNFGILDLLSSGKYIIPTSYVDETNFLRSNSKYYISNSSSNPNYNTTQLYNISQDVDLTALKVSFKNSFLNDTTNVPNLFYYYYVDPNEVNTSTWHRTETTGTINYVQNLLDLNHLLSQKFITDDDYNNPFFNPTLEKDIPDFQIDFNTSKNTDNPMNNGIVDITKLEYPSIGHFMGYRKDILKTSDSFLKSTVLDLTDRVIKAEKYFDTAGENYIFIKINNWGNINFFGENFLAKILLTSGLGNPKLDAYVNQGYKFRQPININKLNIELVDYLGNTLDLNGFDVSCSLKITQVISSEQKNLLEKQTVFFNY